MCIRRWLSASLQKRRLSYIFIGLSSYTQALRKVGSQLDHFLDFRTNRITDSLLGDRLTTVGRIVGRNHHRLNSDMIPQDLGHQ
ncbi:hypothetical protein BDR03DRAFT_941489 [Suillus americanus]|nr:hypothetical protein BDR03DRAFT_941489 [Suillus americanus]